ncbi:glycine oxidase [Roseibium hamelinense]|uniref:Glycine oxidase n=1 Tax=Roseibium hamelinense TaxID=150831 RepID=A0A562SQ81_9HYPH|nr:FAD-dependent oxidoreductase [Roseibium hamelinense]MTI44314.1 FAD-dependent oxidoreductase [Roseibium hamelinense]TWI82910.1 glycine oxidase [Roseibium hamelinense]
MTSSIHIIGAGVAGLCVAAELVDRGMTVDIFDKNGLPGPHGCSWWAGGMLAPWCEYENAEEPVLRLGQQALSWWSGKTTLTRNGTLVVASRRDLPELRRFAQQTAGYVQIDEAKLLGLEPDLTGFTAGLFFEKEAHLDPRTALSDLVQLLLQAGARFHTGAAPDDFSVRVDCRGFSAKNQLQDLRGVKGEMLIVRAPEVQIGRPVRLLHPRIPVYVVPRGDGVYMIGATMIESEDKSGATVRSVLELLSSAYALNPGFGEAELLEIGVDLRPAFPDNLPRIRRRGRYIYANGLYRHGYLLAPALASGVADLILNNEQSELVDEDCP